jgi:DNA-3-methyladenine glycosylase
VAPDLLGRYLVRELDGQRLVLRVVETEAYLGAEDRASHAWRGRRTARTQSLFQPGGYAYVYFVYGMHHCLNAVTGEPEDGSAVLLRAGEPLEGSRLMRERRGLQRPARPGELAGGPARLCQALGIDRSLDRAPLFRGPLRLTYGEPVAADGIAAGPRVGVDYAGTAAHWPLRFALRAHPHVSRPRLES